VGTEEVGTTIYLELSSDQTKHPPEFYSVDGRRQLLWPARIQSPWLFATKGTRVDKHGFDHCL